jgi:hypothetical protein
VSMMHLLLTLSHSIDNVEGWSLSVFQDPSVADGRSRGQKLFLGASKQDMLTKF